MSHPMNPEDPGDTVVVGCRMPRPLRDWLEEVARQERRSMNAVIRLFLEQARQQSDEAEE